MKIGGVVFMIVGVLWLIQGADSVSGKTVMDQSQLFYVGIGTAIMGLALFISSSGQPPNR